MQIDDDAVVPYRKKRVKKPPKKADHKHNFVNCVFSFNPETVKYIRSLEFSIGSYCPICGKVGSTGPGLRDCKWTRNDAPPGYYHTVWTDAALREFDPKTRTLPYFMLDDYFQKYVKIK